MPWKKRFVGCSQRLVKFCTPYGQRPTLSMRATPGWCGPTWNHYALKDRGTGSSPELPAPGQAPLGRSESEEEASGNWVAHFDNTQSREGMEAGVLLVSPMGELHKYTIQLAGEGCASSTAECEALLASLRIAAMMGISRLSIRGDSSWPAMQKEQSSAR
jgi:hypothetical protein